MDNLFLAKTYKKKTISEHTKDVLEKVEHIRNLYGDVMCDKNWELLRLASYYHDFGKINHKFQNKLYSVLGIEKKLETKEEIIEIPHGYISPAFLDQNKLKKEGFNKDDITILINAIYNHHYREVNLKEIELINEIIRILEEEIDEDIEYFYIKDCTENYSISFSFLADVNDVAFRKFIKKKHNYQKYVMIKGLLNKCDYIASAEIDLAEEGVYVKGLGYKQIVDNLFNINNWTKNKLQKDAEIQTGSIVAIASTGIGKTEASLLWGKNKKLFYTLPVRTSLNAMYRRIKDNIGYEKVKLLHSTALKEYFEDIDYIDAIKMYKSASLLTAPLTVCTIDQIFKFVFKYHNFEYIIATLAYSSVIIDEIQMYSADLVATILVALKQIQDFGGKFMITTATLPKYFLKEMDNLGINYKLLDKKDYLMTKKRHKVELIEGEFDIGAIEELAEKNKVLVVCNTVKKAQECYKQLQIENKRILHSRFIKKHRSLLEKEILEFAPNKGVKGMCNTGVWVTTQLVEASLDIDFDILISEMCSIDSLFQRMGRVFRNRENVHRKTNIFVYNNANGRGTVVDKDVYDFSLNALKLYNRKLLSEEAKQEMMDCVYDESRNTSLNNSNYVRKVNKKIKVLNNIEINSMTKMEAVRKFRDIMSCTVVPETIFNKLIDEGKIDEWDELLKDDFVSAIEKRKIYDEINEYTLSLRYNENLPVDFETEAFYQDSKIFRCDCEYDYNDEDKRGAGLIIDYNKKLSDYELQKLFF